VEGLHKVIFSLRWLLGFYDSAYCPLSCVVGALLGLLQTMMGMTTCVLCIEVIFASKSVLDTFFNYVALAFIAEVDNIVLNSRIARSFLAIDAEIRTRWASDEKVEAARARLGWMIFACNAAFLVMLPIVVLMSLVHNRASKDPVEFDWLAYVPRTLALLLSANAAMWLGSRRYGICRTAFALTVIFSLMQVAPFVAMKAPKIRGCLVWSPPEKCVLWVFSIMLLPTSCAAEPRPFGMLRAIPIQVLLLIAQTLLATYQMTRYGC